MGGCLGSKEGEVAPEGKEISDGPVKDRHCTDILCIPIFLLAQVVFIVVTIAGVQDGDPAKLYKPRDYRGNYCGFQENWNNGTNTLDAPMLSFTMNVSSTIDLIMKQMVCSSVARTALVDGGGGIEPLIADQDEQTEYLCDCCLIPCEKCTGSIATGGDLTSPEDLSSVISGKMSELTNPSDPGDLFETGGANGGRFSTDAFWSEATKFFNQVCLPDCNTNFDSVNATTDPARSYTYKPSPDDDLAKEWSLILNADSNTLLAPLKTAIETQFTFKALPKSLCPYENPALCVPMPGIEFKELGSDYCGFEMSAEVAEAVGAAASSAFSGLAESAAAEGMTESFGTWVGDFMLCIDSFFVTAFLSFVIGIVFLVLLRFFIGVCVWIAVLMTILAFFVFGGMMIVRSGQCSDASFLESGQQQAVAVAVTAKVSVTNAVNGEEAVSEDMTGDGRDYNGVQHYSRTGKSCASWDSQTRMPTYTPDNYPKDLPFPGLKGNLCRNPYNESDVSKASTIWCVTTDDEIVWEECIPVGVIQPECTSGYAIANADARQVLFYCGFIVWGVGAIWVIVIVCMVNRIRLAIALNKVAAEFLATNPFVLLLPIVQAIVGILWTVAWMASAAFLLSQVPTDYISDGYFATYAEAAGTNSPCASWETGDHCVATPGACTDKWPTGSVWKDDVCEMGDDGISKCWRCAPPRYVLDIRFAISFFVYLWNNAFNVALGQIMIAMGVAIWFFAIEKFKTPILLRSVKTIFRYHLGSVAFGSFIVAVVQFIRYLMKYFEKQAQAQKNRIMVLVLKVVQCCLWCFEKCIKFLNKNAYIQIALTGKNFCTSAKKAFFLIARNILRFGTVAVLGSVIHSIGMMCIIAGTALVGYFIVRAMHPEVSPVMPVLVAIAMGYLVSRIFMTVFGLAVDTSLQCFLACEEAGATGDFVPSSLKSFINGKVGKKGKDTENE